MLKDNVLFEKTTGTWCGWCPYAGLILNEVQNSHSNIIPVYIHNGNDPLTAEDGNIVAGEFSNGSPSGLFNRIKFEDQWNVGTPRDDWEEIADEYLPTFQSPVNISSTSSFTESTNSILIDASINVDGNISEDLFINCYIMEDYVSDPAYAQANYFNEQEGHPLENLGDPIINYNHRYVLRENAWRCLRYS